MARIRQVCPSFVELDEQAQEQWTSEAAARMLNYRVELASSLVWLSEALAPAPPEEVFQRKRMKLQQHLKPSQESSNL